MTPTGAKRLAATAAAVWIAFFSATGFSAAQEPTQEEVSRWASDFLPLVQSALRQSQTTVPIGRICDSYADGTGAVVCYPAGMFETAMNAPRDWQPAHSRATIEGMRADAPKYMDLYIDRALAILEDRQWRVGRFLGFELFQSDEGGTAYNVSHVYYQMDRVGQALSEIAEFGLWNDLERDIAGAWYTEVEDQSEEVVTRGAVNQLVSSRMFMLCAMMTQLAPNPICDQHVGQEPLDEAEMGRIMLLGAWDQQENMMKNGVSDWRVAMFDSQRVIEHDFSDAVAMALAEPNMGENPNNPIWDNPFLTGNPYTTIIHGE